MAIDRSGGPAFPQLGWEETGGGVFKGQEGLTIRDWFAGMALAGFCANPEVHGTAKDLALPAYVQADAMIKEREK